MSGSDWSLIFLALIGMIQVLGLALIQRGRKDDKSERAVVAAKVEDTAVIAADTKDIAIKTHDIANSRYDELKDELVKSNARVAEQNKQIMKLLQQRNGIREIDTETPRSGIITAEAALPDDVGNQEGAP